MLDVLKDRFPVVKRIPRTLYRLKCSFLLLQLRHNYIRDWLFEEYSNEDMIITSDNDDKEDETLVGFMPSHLDREMAHLKIASII